MKLFRVAFLTLLTGSAFANTIEPTYVNATDDYGVNPPPPPQYSIIVDRSDFTMDVFVDDEHIETRRVIVGRKGRETPLIDTEITHIELNPTWDVPKSIADDMVRKFKGKEDPIAYIKRNGYYFVGPDGNHIAPEEIDWTTISDYGPYEFKLKQKPGDLNMLGNVMFVLKGTGGVQMHGTSSPYLFENETRAYSSGCIRVDGANDLAASILDKTPDEFASYRKKMGEGKWIKLPDPIPVTVIE